ncbi:MAG: hypothetical protein U0641_09805 [Anaerolineae bacterium]
MHLRTGATERLLQVSEPDPATQGAQPSQTPQSGSSAANVAVASGAPSTAGGSASGPTGPAPGSATPMPSTGGGPSGPPPSGPPQPPQPPQSNRWGGWRLIVATIVALLVCAGVVWNGVRLAQDHQPPTPVATGIPVATPTPLFPVFRGPGPRPTVGRPP